jgi:membrane protease YdiL (CAAX protease family)
MKRKTTADTALGFAIPILIVGFVVSLIWVAEQPDWLRSAHILFFVIVMYAVSTAAQVRAERRLDEVELAATRFAARWALVAGVAFVAILCLSPPVQSLLSRTADAFGRTDGSNMAVEARMFLLGVVSTMVAQEAFRFVLTGAWRWSKR